MLPKLIAAPPRKAPTQRRVLRIPLLFELMPRIDLQTPARYVLRTVCRPVLPIGETDVAIPTTADGARFWQFNVLEVMIGGVVNVVVESR